MPHLDIGLRRAPLFDAVDEVPQVRLLQFSSGATESLRKALSEAKAQGATSVILDLRGNPGGFVNEAVGVASEFLPSGVVYLTEDADGHRTPAAVKEGGLWTDQPLVVLVDRSTASSAEIVASGQSGTLEASGGDKAVSAERRKSLLAMTPLGQAVLRSERAKSA